MEPSRPARILIIEDEALLALDLQDMLIDCGFNVAAVAGRLGEALERIADSEFDIAIIDANLAGVSAGPAAAAITAKGLPFIVLSGYSPDQQTALAGAAFIRKPCGRTELVRSLKAALPPTPTAADQADGRMPTTADPVKPDRQHIAQTPPGQNRIEKPKSGP